jgi:hypothetical protein
LRVECDLAKAKPVAQIVRQQSFDFPAVTLRPECEALLYIPREAWKAVPQGRLNFRLVQISFFHDSMEPVQLESSSSAECARSLSKQQTQSRRDETIKSPARKCRVSITNGSSPGRDGTERHSSPSGSSSFDPDPNLISQARVAAAARPIKSTLQSRPVR